MPHYKEYPWSCSGFDALITPLIVFTDEMTFSQVPVKRPKPHKDTGTRQITLPASCARTNHAGWPPIASVGSVVGRIQADSGAGENHVLCKHRENSPPTAPRRHYFNVDGASEGPACRFGVFSQVQTSHVQHSIGMWGPGMSHR